MAFQIATGAPSVSVSEFDETTSVPALGATPGAFAGIFKWGPVGLITPISSEINLKQVFGGPTDWNAETWFTAANFLGYGSFLQVVRAANTTSANSNGTLSAIANSAALTNAIPYYTIPNLEAYNALSNGYFTGTGAAYVAKFPGVIGNSLKISQCDSATAFASNLNLLNVSGASGNLSICANSSNTNLTFSVGSNVAVITLVNAISFSDANTTALANYIANNFFTNGDLIVAGNTSIGTVNLKIINATVVTVNVATVNTGTATVTLQLNAAFRRSTNVSTTVVQRKWEYSTYFSGAPGQSTFVLGQGNTAANDQLHIAVIDHAGLFSGTPGTVLKTWPFLSRANDALASDGSALYYKKVLASADQFVYAADDISGAVSNTAANITSSTNLLPFSRWFKSGQDGLAEGSVSFADIANAYDNFNDASLNMALVLTGKNDSQGILANYVIQNVCEARRDCVAFITPNFEATVNNPGNEVASITTFWNSLVGSSYGFADTAYKYQYDKYNDVFRWIPLNGDTAGLCVRTDNQRAPWYSPAGYNRGIYRNVVKLSWNPSSAEAGLLYNINMNPVITVAGTGSLLDGDRTLLPDQTSAFNQLGVRRLFIVIEKAIAGIAKYDLFEFNDTFTQQQFVSMITPYLNGIQAARGLTAFQIVCDGTNNTAQVVDARQFIGDIYLKPARSINFINLNFIAIATSVTFDEIVGTLGI